MKTPSFKETIQLQLIQAAKSYSALLDKRIEISSSDFKLSKKYVIRFYKSNFLHLTGVLTSMAPEDFFNKCFEETIALDDFNCESTSQIKGLTRLKMKHMVTIGSFFDSEIDVQEDFEKGAIKCLVGASNNRCTIGFVDAKYCVRPRTILDKNHLDELKPIIKVKPIMV